MSIWNLLPGPPWQYPWTPAIISAAFWFCLVIIGFCFFLSVKSNRVEIGRFLAFALVLRLLLVPWSPVTAPVHPASDPVAEWRSRSWQAQQILETLKLDRESIQDRFTHDQEGQAYPFLVAEIDEIDGQIGAVERESERLGNVVVGMESRERRKDRQEMVSGVLSNARREESIRREVEVGE